MTTFYISIALLTALIALIILTRLFMDARELKKQLNEINAAYLKDAEEIDDLTWLASQATGTNDPMERRVCVGCSLFTICTENGILPDKGLCFKSAKEATHDLP